MAPVTRLRVWARAARCASGSGGRFSNTRAPSIHRASSERRARASSASMPQSSRAAGHRPKRKTTRAASAAALVPTWAPIEALVAELIAGTQRGSRAAGVLRRLVHGVGVTGRDEPERFEAVDPRDRDLVGDAAEVRGDPVGERGTDGVAHLDGVAADDDPAVAVDLDRAERTVGAGAVVLGDAGDAGSDQPGRGRGRGPGALARSVQIGWASSLSRISGVRTDTLYGLPVIVRPPVLRALRRRNSIGSSGSAAAASSTSTSSAVSAWSVP